MPSRSHVVTLDVDDQRIVQLSHAFYGVEDATHLRITIGKRRRVHLHHVRKDFLLVGIE